MLSDLMLPKVESIKDKWVLFRREYKCIIVEGSRGTGKSTLIRNLAEGGLVFPIKFQTFLYNTAKEEENSPIRQEFLLQYLEQMPLLFPIPIFDRMIGTDIVMGRITKRPTMFQSLFELEERWSKIAFQVILTCSPSVRLARIPDRSLEGLAEDVEIQWEAWTYETPIPSIVIDASSGSLDTFRAVMRALSSNGVIA